MKRLRFKVESLSFDGSHFHIHNEHVHSGLLMHFFPSDVTWFYDNGDGTMKQKSISVGTTIECEIGVCGFLNDIVIID